MIALRIFLVMVSLTPIRGVRDYAYRWELAEAIASVTADEHEQDVLARIAWFESGFRRNVARCEVKGDSGKSHGAFQVQPITARDAKYACSNDLSEQCSVALDYVHRSAAACPDSTGAATLNLYVSGKCFAKPLKQARDRWGPN